MYMQTLARLKELPNLKVICPGHGPLIYDPYDCIDDYIRRRLVREQEILALLAEGPALTSWTMVEKLYADVDRRLWRAADRVVQTHLRKLLDEGRIIASEGKRRSPEAAKWPERSRSISGVWTSSSKLTNTAPRLPGARLCSKKCRPGQTRTSHPFTGWRKATRSGFCREQCLSPGADAP